MQIVDAYTYEGAPCSLPSQQSALGLCDASLEHRALYDLAPAFTNKFDWFETQMAIEDVVGFAQVLQQASWGGLRRLMRVRRAAQ